MQGPKEQLVRCPCSHCGWKNRVPPRLIGQTVTCKGCGREIVISGESLSIPEPGSLTVKERGLKKAMAAAAAVSGTCGFCRNAPAVLQFPLDLYMVLQRDGPTTLYSTMKTPVPRCESCGRLQERFSLPALRNGLIAAGIVVIACLLLLSATGHGPGVGLTIGLIIGPFVGLGAALIFNGMYGRRYLQGALSHPMIIWLCKEGWIIGEPPSGATMAT